MRLVSQERGALCSPGVVQGLYQSGVELCRPWAALGALAMDRWLVLDRWGHLGEDSVLAVRGTMRTHGPSRRGACRLPYLPIASNQQLGLVFSMQPHACEEWGLSLVRSQLAVVEKQSCIPGPSADEAEVGWKL